MILLSAGHFPLKKGACYKGFCEYPEANKWVDEIIIALGDKCLKVPTGTLKEKVTFINSSLKENENNIAVEIHFNAAQNDKREHIGNGCETLYYPNSSKGMIAAEEIQMNLSRLLPPNRGTKEGWYQMNKKNGPDYFLAKTRCTALIIEPAFIHRVELIEENRKGACALIAESLIGIVK